MMNEDDRKHKGDGKNIYTYKNRVFEHCSAQKLIVEQMLIKTQTLFEHSCSPSLLTSGIICASHNQWQLKMLD